MLKFSQSPSTIPKILRALDALFTDVKSLLIVLHDNPDPDALASGMALKTLCESRYAISTAIAHGGMINRAENKSMVSELGITLSNIDKINAKNFDRIAVVDTQPGRGNNSLPPQTHCHLVFDHHATVDNSTADLIIYNKNIGATATLLCELLRAASIDIKTNLATAIAYAIRTETLELQREASSRDAAMYLYVYPLSSLRKIGAIISPNLPNSYFEMLSIALGKALIFRRFIFVPLGNVVIPEIVAEMADLFLRRERVTWVLAMGRYESAVYLSIRTTHYRGGAFRVLQNILNDTKNAGGHDAFAGGRIAIENEDFDLNAVELNIANRFAAHFGFEKAVWKNLVKNQNVDDMSSASRYKHAEKEKG